MSFGTKGIFLMRPNSPKNKNKENMITYLIKLNLSNKNSKIILLK